MTRLETSRGALSNGKTKFFAPRFSLRLLLIVVLACGLVLGWIGSRVDRHRKDLANIARLQKVGYVGTGNDVPEWIQEIVSYDWLEIFDYVRHVSLLPDKATYDEKFGRSKNVFDGYSGPAPYCDGSGAADDDMLIVSRFSDVEVLFASFTSISDVGFSHLKSLTNLRQVYLDHTDLTDKGLASLRYHKNIRDLSIAETMVSDRGLQHLRHFLELEDLSLADTSITGDGLKHIARLPKLKTIDLNGTRIDDNGLLELKDVKTLEQVCTDRTAITEAGKVQLKRYPRRVTFPIVRVRS